MNTTTQSLLALALHLKEIRERLDRVRYSMLPGAATAVNVPVAVGRAIEDLRKAEAICRKEVAALEAELVEKYKPRPEPFGKSLSASPALEPGLSEWPAPKRGPGRPRKNAQPKPNEA